MDWIKSLYMELWPLARRRILAPYRILRYDKKELVKKIGKKKLSNKGITRMKKILAVLCCCGLLFLLAGCDGESSEAKEAREKTQTAVAERMVDYWMAGDIASASADFAPEMAERGDAATLEEIRQSMLEEFGAFIGRDESTWKNQGKQCARVYVKCQFEKYWVDINVAVDENNQILAITLETDKATEE